MDRMSSSEDPALSRPRAGIIVLRSGDARLEASPGDGGTLIGWSVGGVDLLRRRPPGETDPLQSSCFALAPFSNVVRGGGFRFQGVFHALARNHPLEPDPIHGDSWRAPWNLDELGGRRVRMSYAHDAGSGFPLPYHASQELLLARRSLTVTLRLTNTSGRAMPGGLGLHPYFRRLPGTRLHVEHGGRWDGLRVLPDSRFCMAQEIGDETVDACYASWRGVASLHWPGDEVIVTLRAPSPASAVVVFSPSRSDFVCVEPVTHVNDGFNAFASGIPGTGVRVLEPGEEISLRTVMSVHLGASS